MLISGTKKANIIAKNNINQIYDIIGLSKFYWKNNIDITFYYDGRNRTDT